MDFDIEDYLSLYMSDKVKRWVKDTYMHVPHRDKFIAICGKNADAGITVNAVLIAQHLFEKHNILVFPWVIISRTQVLNTSNWKMPLLDESTVIHSTVPIHTVIDYLKAGGVVKLAPDLDHNVIELTIG